MLRTPQLMLALCLAALFGAAGCGNSKGSGQAGIKGVGAFTYSITGGAARLSAVFATVPLDAGARVPLARPAGAFVELSPDFQSGGTLFVLSVPLASLLKGASDLPMVGLPDGRPLPGVASGALAAVAFPLPAFGLTYFYLGGDAYGLFVPAPLPEVPVLVSSNMVDERGNLLGQIWGVPPAGKGSSSGILFLFPTDGGGATIF